MPGAGGLQGSVLLDCGLKSLCPRVSLQEGRELPQPSYCLRGILTSGWWAPAWACRGQAPLSVQGGPWSPAGRSVFPLDRAKTFGSLSSPGVHAPVPSLLETQTPRSWASPPPRSSCGSPWVLRRQPPAHVVPPRAQTQKLLYNLKLVRKPARRQPFPQQAIGHIYNLEQGSPA